MRNLLTPLLLLLLITSCGGVKSGPGVDSGTCSAGVVKDYREAASACETAFRGNGRRSEGFEACATAFEDFLAEYPKVSCDIENERKRSTGTRIEHGSIRQRIEMMRAARSYPQYP